MAGSQRGDRMSDLLEIIQRRQSARGPFDPNHSIAKVDVEQILEAARRAPTAHNMQNFEIIVIDDSKQLEAIGKIRSQVSEVFFRENFQQMSFSEEELRRKKVGVLARMFPPSWRKPDAKPDMADAMAHSFLGSALQQTPAFAHRDLRFDEKGAGVRGRCTRHDEPGMHHGEHVAHGRVTGHWVSYPERFQC
jgi:nitroreductase